MKTYIVSEIYLLNSELWMLLHIDENNIITWLPLNSFAKQLSFKPIRAGKSSVFSQTMKIYRK